MKKNSVFYGILVAGLVISFYGCGKQEDKTAPKTAGMPGKVAGQQQMPPGMSGKEFPKEMLEAMAKMEKKPGAAVTAQGMPGTQSVPGMQGMPAMGKSLGPKAHKPVVIPANVQGKWKSVVIQVLHKQTAKTKDYTVDIQKDFAVPDTRLSIKILNFLPNFTMTPQAITSASNDAANPAAQVIIYENGKSIFEGWLFQKHPAVHSFQHKSFGIILKDQKKA